MKEETRKLLDKSAHALRAARLLLENGETAFAVGRAYYAMFYAAEALLWEEGRRSHSHSGVHSLFGEQFAKTGRLEAFVSGAGQAPAWGEDPPGTLS